MHSLSKSTNRLHGIMFINMSLARK